MRRVLLVVLAAVLCAVVIRTVAAQSGQRAGGAAPAQTPKRAWYSVNIVNLKAGSGPAWREFTKSQVIPMQQKGGVKMRQTWQSGAPFGEGGAFAVLTPIEKFEDYDKPPLVTRVLAGDALRTYQEKNASLVAGNRMFAIQDRAELSMPPASMAKVVAMILTDVTILPGHAAAYEAFIKNDFLPVLKKANVTGFAVSRTIFGGDGDEYHEAQYIESYGEIDKGPAQARVLTPAEGQALAAKRTPHIKSVNRTILRFVPDLSYSRPTT